jgi:transposase
MTNTSDRIEIITSVLQRRRWTAAEKMRLVEATFAPGMTVSLVARQNGIASGNGRWWCAPAAGPAAI